jgi:hypothetical protein
MASRTSRRSEWVAGLISRFFNEGPFYGFKSRAPRELASAHERRSTVANGFISEDDLETFEGWLRCQAVDAAASTSEELAMWRGLFDEGRKLAEAAPKVG